MAPKDSSDCMVNVTIEIGHKADCLDVPTNEGFTHDWTAFVKGRSLGLDQFVKKVVFHLPKTFKMPTRTICEPPFTVSELGYESFILPIDVHFKNKQLPTKLTFEYNIFLNAQHTPNVKNVHYEKLHFKNPYPEFKAKLLEAGGTEQNVDQPRVPQLSSPYDVSSV